MGIWWYLSHAYLLGLPIFGIYILVTDEEIRSTMFIAGIFVLCWLLYPIMILLELSIGINKEGSPKCPTTKQ